LYNTNAKDKDFPLAKTITRTFSIRAETDEKLVKLTKLTLYRTKSNVIDVAVEKYWQELTSGQAVEGKRLVAVQGADGILRADPNFK